PMKFGGCVVQAESVCALHHLDEGEAMAAKGGADARAIARRAFSDAEGLAGLATAARAGGASDGLNQVLEPIQCQVPPGAFALLQYLRPRVLLRPRSDQRACRPGPRM